MSDFIGYVLLKQVGCFIRWILLGAKGNFKDFYDTKNMFLVDFFIGVLLFFMIMFIVVEVF